MVKSFTRKLNTVAAAVILGGAMFLATPAKASAESADVCCQIGSGPRCCGGACEATATTCEACTTFLGCLLF